ncbi:toll/interleukin-1 receptor domain-containing protein [Bradyrhizobium japonicum]|uniref:toll/interleukin-1 receptor domain-containing protein n=1 Tax=Bradyrhizobium japonicum TaxID=375 RepID=UPI001BA9E8AC|nr:toll/interleukin-1 receptor domain-containing protein [Bradyrhizobium japonicum]MBR0911482.1 toll/interleukin-1 receptor domain-containing protein [Bradyrhizobium japonicum]
MVEYLTREQLRRSGGTITETASILRKAASRSPAGSSFLSHSSQDVDILPAAIKILEDHGAQVYVDKKDETLPPTTNRETAAALRDRIQQCRKFILLATANCKDSRWAPWELGLADGYRRTPNIAIFPGLDSLSDRTWAEREYLGVYDRVVYGQHANYPNPVYMVWNQTNNTGTELRAWLQRP